MHTWRFEFKLGGPLVAAWRATRLPGDVKPLSKPIRMHFESPLQTYCLWYLCSAQMGAKSGNSHQHGPYQCMAKRFDFTLKYDNLGVKRGILAMTKD